MEEKNKLEKELELIASEINQFSNIPSNPVNSMIDRIKMGMEIKKLFSLKDMFLRFYPIADNSLLSEDCKKLYTQLLQEEQEVSQLFNNQSFIEKLNG